MIIIAIVGGLLILGILGAIGAILIAGHNQKQANTETVVAASADVELIQYQANTNTDFSMLVPKEMELTYEADEELEGGYVVGGGSSSEEFGNRFVTVRKEVYPGSLSQEYYAWLEEQKASVEELVATESETSGVKASVVSQDPTKVGEYSAYRVRTETATTLEDGSVNSVRHEYMFVYVSATVTYLIHLEGNTADTKFQDVNAKMLESFKITKA